MMEEIKLTIITVVFNGEGTIKETLDNLLELTYKNFSFIVIDGNSSDNTVNILKVYESKFREKETQFKWMSEKDNGIYDAMNKGWNMAEGNSYILFLGSGDKILKMPNIKSFVNTDVVYGNVMKNNKLFKSLIDFRTRFGNTIHHQAMFVKKSVCPESPFNITYKVYADFDFNQRMIKEGKKFVKDSAFLGYALEGGVSSDFNYSEAYRIANQNFGKFNVFLAKIYFFLQRNIRMKIKK